MAKKDKKKTKKTKSPISQLELDQVTAALARTRDAVSQQTRNLDRLESTLAELRARLEE